MPVAAIVTVCSNRKRIPPRDELRARDLRAGILSEIAANWAHRLAHATPIATARKLYCGRNFTESRKAADALSVPLYIISAGLGLVHANDVVPSYSLTISAGSPDSILARITREISAREWWQAGAAQSPYSRGVYKTLEVFRHSPGLVFMALPGGYLRMVQHELAQLPNRVLSRLRLFSGTATADIEPRLQALIMPYDGRLDGGDSDSPGTKTDFAGRALADFAEWILPVAPEGDADAHQKAVSLRLANWAYSSRPNRARHTDEQLLKLIRENLNEVGSASRMLRFFRDELGIACEQARFGSLFARVQSDGSR